MHARHTQGRADFCKITSKTLVNGTRMKVVNIALTKFFLSSWPGLTRPSISFETFSRRGMDARVKPAHDDAYDLRLPGRGLAERGLRCGEAGDRHAVGRAGDVIEPDLVAERHRGRIAAVFAADTDLE